MALFFEAAGWILGAAIGLLILAFLTWGAGWLWIGIRYLAVQPLVLLRGWRKKIGLPRPAQNPKQA